MSSKLGGICFVGFWIIVGIGMNLEEKTDEGQAQGRLAWAQAAKNIAADTECDEIHYPDECAAVRRKAELDAQQRLKHYR